MASRKPRQFHVVLHNDKWAVRAEGNTRNSSVHSTQRDAIDAGRKIAQDTKGELVIHARDGRIRGRTQYYPKFPSPRKREVIFPTGVSVRKQKAIRKAVQEVLNDLHGVK